MSIIERILPVLGKNYYYEKRDAVWNDQMSRAMQVEFNEYNFENMCQTALVSGFFDAGGKDEIIKLAEAIGICGISNPETDAFLKRRYPPPSNIDSLSMDDVLDRVQSELQFRINFPPFHGNCTQGVHTKYGIAPRRHIFYLWILKRIIELCPDNRAGIIEIGAGFGVLGYYLDRIGYRDYTTIDLALVNACQTYFLSKNLPDRTILISGDVEDPFDLKHKDAIKLLHANDFKNIPRNRFVIMVNMDGLTEYGIQEAEKYMQHNCALMLLSVNHEVNPYRVCEISQPLRKREYRYPFWLRGGYVEELYVPK